MNSKTDTPILPGCSVLPPMDEGKGSQHGHQGNGTDQGTANKAKGKTGRRKTSDRFAVLNAFVDFTAGGLSRNEILVWLVLYRDTKAGTARTSQADLARRAGVSDRTIRRAIAGLQKKGLLRVAYRGGIGRGASAYCVRPVPPDK